MDESTDSKTCSKCGDTKPRGEFGRRSASRDGLFSKCKSCRKSEAADYYAGLSDERKATRLSRSLEIRDQSPEARAERAEKARAKRSDWSEDERQHAREQQRDWYAARPGAKAEHDRRYREAHKEELANKSREKRIRNADQIRAAKAAYHLANAERIREKVREWAAANPDQVSAQRAKTRAKRYAQLAATTIEPVNLAGLWTGLCALCGEVIDPDLPWPHRMSKSIDHIIPLSKGGTHTQDNLAWTHLAHNQSKGAKTD